MLSLIYTVPVWVCPVLPVIAALFLSFSPLDLCDSAGSLWFFCPRDSVSILVYVLFIDCGPELSIFDGKSISKPWAAASCFCSSWMRFMMFRGGWRSFGLLSSDPYLFEYMDFLPYFASKLTNLESLASSPASSVDPSLIYWSPLRSSFKSEDLTIYSLSSMMSTACSSLPVRNSSASIVFLAFGDLVSSVPSNSFCVLFSSVMRLVSGTLFSWSF